LPYVSTVYLLKFCTLSSVCRLARSAKYQAEKSAKEEELKKKQQEKLQAEAEASAARAAANR